MLSFIKIYRHRKALRNVRKGFACVGFSVDHLTDAELEAGLIQGAEIMGQAGITVNEAIEAFNQFCVAQAIKSLEELPEPSASHTQSN